MPNLNKNDNGKVMDALLVVRLPCFDVALANALLPMRTEGEAKIIIDRNHIGDMKLILLMVFKSTFPIFQHMSLALIDELY